MDAWEGQGEDSVFTEQNFGMLLVAMAMKDDDNDEDEFLTSLSRVFSSPDWTTRPGIPAVTRSSPMPDDLESLASLFDLELSTSFFDLDPVTSLTRGDLTSLADIPLVTGTGTSFTTYK